MKACKTKGCKNGAQKGHFCYKCASRRYKANNPVRYSFNAHRLNARRRGIQWGLTFEQFSEFAEQVDLISRAGIYKESYHIDRIDNSKGYVTGNIQVLTNSENIKKENRRRKYLKYDFTTHEAKFLIERLEQDPTNLPF